MQMHYRAWVLLSGGFCPLAFVTCVFCLGGFRRGAFSPGLLSLRDVRLALQLACSPMRPIPMPLVFPHSFGFVCFSDESEVAASRLNHLGVLGALAKRHQPPKDYWSSRMPNRMR